MFHSTRRSLLIVEWYISSVTQRKYLNNCTNEKICIVCSIQLVHKFKFLNQFKKKKHWKRCVQLYSESITPRLRNARTAPAPRGFLRVPFLMSLGLRANAQCHFFLYFIFSCERICHQSDVTLKWTMLLINVYW